MIHVFLLLLYIGQGDGKKLVSGDMYFYSITDCNWYAAQVTKRFGNYRYSDLMDKRDRATLYCVPVSVDPNIVEVF